MDDSLLDILCCPAGRRPLQRLDSTRLKALNEAVAAGSVQYVDGSPVSDTAAEALVTDDFAVIYLLNDGIPVLLVERGIGTQQFADFSAGRM